MTGKDLSLIEQVLEAVEQARQEGWSVNAIAGEAGISQPILFRLVTGQRQHIHSETMQRLADFFGMRLTKPRIRKPPAKE